MRAVLLAPRRVDKGHRDVLWAWCKARWEARMPDVRVYEGHHDDGPFNRSAAVNEAARLADRDGSWDVGVVIDADVFLPISHVRQAIAGAAGGVVTWAHRRWRGIAEEDTKRLIRDPDDFGDEPGSQRDMDLIVDKTTPVSWSCCVAVPRTTFDDMGGFDERFRGWGFEDGAWSALVRGLYRWDRIEGDVYHWWHPRSGERIVQGLPGTTARPEYIRNALLGRRYMIACIRDHAVGDQPGEHRLSPEMVMVHVANLTRDDRRFLAMARSRGMPEANWADWWPTLEELRDGARAASRGSTVSPRPTVTLIVHTDGRREYISRSVPSLLEQLNGPVIKRVIYDDSGDPAYKAWLAETFPIFNVVGPARRLGYTGSMRAMWSYLDRRCQSDYVFQAEDDFLYDEPIDLEPMIQTLAQNPYLRQLALLRDAYYPRELEAGGIIAEHPEAYEHVHANGHSRVEHRLYFTANPSLFRRSLCRTPWPSAPSSERVYTDLLNRDPNSRFAYWGDGTPVIRHIGAERIGTGY